MLQPAGGGWVYGVKDELCGSWAVVSCCFGDTWEILEAVCWVLTGCCWLAVDVPMTCYFAWCVTTYVLSSSIPQLCRLVCVLYFVVDREVIPSARFRAFGGLRQPFDGASLQNIEGLECPLIKTLFFDEHRS